jgi:hypothetical protein
MFFQNNNKDVSSSAKVAFLGGDSCSTEDELRGNVATNGHYSARTEGKEGSCRDTTVPFWSSLSTCHENSEA